MRRFHAVPMLLAMLLVSACAAVPSAPDAGAMATVSALSTANAQLSAQVAELAALITTPTVTPAPAADVATSPTQAVAPAAVPVEPVAPLPAALAPAPAAGGGELPRLVAEVAVAPEEATLFDLRVDRASNHIFVTDTTRQFHVLDATTYAVIKTMPIGGWITLDSANGRVYVNNPYVTEGEDASIHVIDTTTLEEVGTLTGRALAVDAQRNRLFVGEPYLYNTAQTARGVRIVDGATLQETGLFTQTGAPVYNPLRNEVLIVAYTVYTADPETRQVTGDLFPDLTDFSGGGFAWCNGCAWADNAQFHANDNLISVSIPTHCPQGCGKIPPPVFFDAATMQPIDPAVAPQMQADCGSQSDLVGPVQGRIYHNQTYARYMVFNNFRVADASGAPLTWRDGLRTEFIDAHTNQGYLYDGRVIDLDTISPVGRWPAACLYAYEEETGLLFGKRGRNLRVLAESGGEPSAAEPAVADTIPEESWITGIHSSPNYANDSTLLVESSGNLYRSADGGASWMRLRGGLSEGDYLHLRAAFSPDYANDRTIYVTGNRGESLGEGVWRSLDGGDTWEPLWTNLTHLRGTDLFFSADFANDRTMVLQAEFNDLTSGISGKSYQQSTDAGLNWTLVVTGDYSTPAGMVPLPPLSELLPGGTGAPDLNVRLADYGLSIEYAPDGTTWQTATIPLEPRDRVLSILPSPAYVTDRTVYVISEYYVWRTTDGGATWSVWNDPKSSEIGKDRAISAAAISPAFPDGGYRLFAGISDGQVWIVDPATAAWQALEPALPATSAPDATEAAAQPLPLPTATPAPVGEALAGNPPEGLFRPEGSFALMWENTARIQQDLGWAKTAGPATIPGAFQRFEGGAMVWIKDSGRILVFFNDGTRQSFEDTFAEGQRESDPAFAPPAGKRQPERGFGKVWREHAEARDKLGWAMAKEEAVNAQVQEFERGTMIRSGGSVFTLVGTDAAQGIWY